jgi:hypothetical protein
MGGSRLVVAAYATPNISCPTYVEVNIPFREKVDACLRHGGRHCARGNGRHGNKPLEGGLEAANDFEKIAVH